MSTHKPKFDTIDYSQPTKYIEVLTSFGGNTDLIENTAQNLVNNNDENTLANVWRWIRTNLHADKKQGDYRWRTASQILERERYFGCAEHALLYGSIIRACGIPAVWVKSLDVDWIQEFANNGRFNGGRGHVYLEVYLENTWYLLDAMQIRLFDSYNRAERLLPGNNVERYAYDKGGDAKELVLSLDWEPWKEETINYFSGFELEKLEHAKSATDGKGRSLAV